MYTLSYFDIKLTSSSSVADEPTRRTASWQTAKFYNSHVTVTTPILLVICHPVARIDIAYLCTKFDDFRFTRSSDMIWATQIIMRHMTWPHTGSVCRPYAVTWTFYLYIKFEVWSRRRITIDWAVGVPRRQPVTCSGNSPLVYDGSTVASQY